MQAITTKDVSIQRLGLGAFRRPGAGYRHSDMAAMYDDEEAVGAAIAASGLPRSDVFVTTKVWHDQLGTRDTIRCAFASLGRFKLDQVVLYMVHWPSADMDMATVMETLTELRDEGRTRAIGVCNFNLPLMPRAVDQIGAPVAALQIEYHPFLDQSAMRTYLGERGIPLTAYAPLAQARAAEDGTLKRIGGSTAPRRPRSRSRRCSTRRA